jgi:hypothetical protein
MRILWITEPGRMCRLQAMIDAAGPDEGDIEPFGSKARLRVDSFAAYGQSASGVNHGRPREV